MHASSGSNSSLQGGSAVIVRLLSPLLLIATLLLANGIASADEMPVPDKQDAIIFIRHALAPGTGDPAEFDVNDCDTQRNLSEQGRKQAEDIGRNLRRLGIADIPVYSSEWCRCKDTAELMNIGSVNHQPLLNSFFATPDGPAQLQKLRQWLAIANGPLVLVTHQVVITGMTGVYPASGEMVLTRLDDGELSVVSTIETEYR